MISGLEVLSGCRSQSPYCSATVNPATDRNPASAPASRNRRVLWLTRGCSQAGLVYVLVNDTRSVLTGN